MKISKGTVIRTMCLGIALINQMLTITGHSPLPIDDETVNLVVTTTATIVTSLAAWWKNNSFTSAAIQADEMLQQIKQS
ncbi:phage holin [Anoxybacterium hadale]|uniref:Phage holin n=1 Tax=Anoxybacterium hadale TaxID=3408580 RepID=A0ACD1ABA1_9FIRM|nr:phage holin [Clostridiales bacterium]